jgi:hypothetical protein
VTLAVAISELLPAKLQQRCLQAQCHLLLLLLAPV